MDEVRALVRTRSPLPPEETERLVAQRFSAMPRRLSFAVERWPLADAAVLDVGCSYGHCLVHFGAGSLGIDNAPSYIEFCRALGLDVVQADVDRNLDEVPDGTFDFGWVSDIVEHVDAPRPLLRRLARKLQPEGRLLVFLTVLPRSRLARAALRRRGQNPFDANAHGYQFTYDTARYLFERAGFRVERVEAPPLPSLPVAGALARENAPRLFIEARRDAAAEERVRLAEQKNKPRTA